MALFKRAHSLDTSFFEPEHDLDLVAMIDNARTEDDIQVIARMCKARLRARRKAARAATR